MQPAGKSSSGLERKEVEKYRRMHMKAHVSRLASLIPTQKKLPLPALLDQATSYVKQLKDRLEELRERREQLQGDEAVTEDQRVALMVPVVAIKETGSVLEVNLVTGVSKSCMLSQIFSVLKEEGAEVVSANRSTVGARTFYSIYSQVYVLYQCPSSLLFPHSNLCMNFTPKVVLIEKD